MRHIQQISSRGASLAICSLFALASVALAAAEEGWIADKNGCKVANPNPQANETVSWEGACVEGFADGEGTMQWFVDTKPGARYVGAVKRGVITGRGKLTLPNGTSYNGDWANGRQEGAGILTTPAGGLYDGQWKEGRPDGPGTMVTPSGETLRGLWREGNLVAPEEQGQHQK